MATSDKPVITGHVADSVNIDDGVSSDGTPLFVMTFRYTNGPDHRMIVDKRTGARLTDDLHDWLMEWEEVGYGH